MRLTLLPILGLVCFSNSSQAQPIPAAPKAEGMVRAFFFEARGLPVSGVRVVEDGEVQATSDREGMVLFAASEGEHTYELTLASGTSYTSLQKITVVRGQETEFLVTFPTAGAGPLEVDVETPKGELEVETASVAVQASVVAGRVVADKDGKPVVGARIFVRGTASDGQSDTQGRFELRLPLGRRELTVIHPGFSTQVVPDVIVGAEGLSGLEVRLTEKSLELAEMVITAPRIEGSASLVLEERQQSASVSDVLGRDQITKAGDSDAASALSRVTGITVIGGRFIYVRGLGERYSSTLLNDSNLPSPDPERRVVPLDIFPTSAIAGLVVQKSYSPDIPGEFGGGIVKIRTREIPEDFVLSLSLSLGANSVTTFQEGLTYSGGGSDWLGFGVAERQLPSEFAKVASERRIDPYVPLLKESGFTSGERERLAEMLDPNFAPRRRTLPPNARLTAEVGGKFQLFGAKAGAYLSTSYNNAWTATENAFRTYSTEASSGTLRLRRNQTILEGENEVALSALGALSLDLNEDQQLRLTVGVFRISSNTASETTGYDDDRATDILKSRLSWSERMVNTNQVRGSHLIHADLGLRLDWRYQLALATLDQPNRRSLRYELQPDGRFSLDPDGTERFYSELLDINHDLAADVSLPLKLFGGRESLFKGGVAANIKARDVYVRRFAYKRAEIRDGAEKASVELLPRDRVFAADTLEPGLQEMEESTRSDDNYRGAQEVFAGYLMGDLALLDALKVQTGLRIEHSAQTIEGTPQPGIERTPFDPVTLSTLDLFPSLTTTWSFLDDMQLRAGLARTVNRPSFRELSPAAFIDLARAREIRGNPELQRAQILHADLRWEWYPSAGETVSVAAFAKLFDSPIENSIKGGANTVAQPINTDSARNLGLEFEARKGLGSIAAVLEDFYLAGNLTLVTSRVSLGEVDTILTSKERALQGQSPYVVNAQLGYDNSDWGTSVSLLFNVFGRRINDVGVEGLPDIYEESRPELNLVVRQRWDRFTLGLKVKNMLNTEYRLTQTEPRDEGEVLDVERYRRGVEFALTIGADLN